MLQYKKNIKPTQGVAGQLNESKLNSLVLYRLLTDPKVKEFYLGSNLDGIGDMDDVCIRLIHDDFKKPLLILIQAKHKDNPNKEIHDSELYIKKSDFYLPKTFNSFLKVKEKFATVETDVFYSGGLEDVMPHFIIYTTARKSGMSDDRIIDPTSSTINIVNNLISSRRLGGQVFQLNITEDDLKKVTNDYSASDRDVAEHFFKNVYFITDQAQQDDVGREIEKGIAINQALETSQLHVRPDSVFLNFYKKVHKWWLLQGNVHYLTQECNFLDSTLNDFVHNAYLSLLHYNYVSFLDLYSIQLTPNSMTSFQQKLFQKFNEPVPTKANVFRIKTNSVLLTSIKLKNCLYNTQKYDLCSYLDYSYVSKMSNSEFEILLGEIQNTEIEILVVILDTTRQVTNNRLENILKEFRKNIVLVTEESQAIDVGNTHNINVVIDHIYGLDDILNVENILKNKIIVQGLETDLSMIIDSKSKYSIINAEILTEILNNDRIEIGRSLFNQQKNENWFPKRTVVLNKMRNNELFKIKEYAELDTFNDINETIVVITGEPGMGKSTLLSLLSAKTKICDPKTWIVRVNLQDYSEDFNTWKENNLDIGLRESMLLVCKAELNEMSNDTYFDLDLTDGGMKLINSKTLQQTSLLLLECIVHCFNKGKIIFLFDGFDKMCPHYEEVTLKFIKNLIFVPSNNTDEKPVSRNRVWITSRPYNTAKDTLEKNFGLPLSLAPLDSRAKEEGKRRQHTQQENFYKMYWQANLRKEHLIINDSNKQPILNNISRFLKNVSQDIEFSSASSIPLQVMYETARDFFQKEYGLKTESISTFHPRDRLHDEALHLAGIPLHLKVYANHFIKCFLNSVQITNSTENSIQNPEKWDFKVNTFEFFEKFHESKLFKVFHEGKKSFYPDCRIRYSEAKNKSVREHKILAFFSILNVKAIETYWRLPIIENGDSIPVFQNFKKMIDHIKKGKEKVGLIDCIHRDVPRFVHQALAECYAVEYVADLLKSYKLKPSINKTVIEFVINYLLDNKIGLMTVFDQKLKNDEELKKVLSTSNTKNDIFNVLMEQSEKNKNSLLSVLENGFKDTAMILVQSIDSIIDSENITTFVNFIGGDFFIYAAALDFVDLLKYVQCKLKEVDRVNGKSEDDDSLMKCVSESIRCELVDKKNITNKDYIVERLNNVGL